MELPVLGLPPVHEVIVLPGAVHLHVPAEALQQRAGLAMPGQRVHQQGIHHAGSADKPALGLKSSLIALIE